VGLFRRKCKDCGQSPELKVEPLVRGQVGASEVEFTDFPYRSCACGHLARWAFDAGLDFSTQLFYDGVATAKGRRGAAKCSRCDAGLGDPEPVELTATAHFDDFAPIGMRLRILGYRCPSCGLEQAPPGEFDAGGRYGSSRSTDSGKALDAAVKSIGLSL
jgi:hypothetical protein